MEAVQASAPRRGGGSSLAKVGNGCNYGTAEAEARESMGVAASLVAPRTGEPPGAWAEEEERAAAAAGGMCSRAGGGGQGWARAGQRRREEQEVAFAR